MSHFVNVGFGNMVNVDKILAIINPDSAPAKRLVSNGKDSKTLIDATQGRKTKSIIVTTDNKIILSSLLSETITGRVDNDINN